MNSTTACGDVCVDTNIDSMNCGSCGTTCGAEEACFDGICGLSCVDGNTTCDGVCVDTSLDAAHCGSCENRCEADEACSDGVCDLSCVEGSSNCDDICVDTNIDTVHCGRCDNTCGSDEACSDEACSDGVCDLSCAEGSTNCDGVCVDTSNDITHCGICGNACGSDETCSEGLCDLICAEGNSNCDGVCVDTSNDTAHCGSCGNACGSDEVCSDAVCEPSCGDGTLACDGICVEINTDLSNCGQSGNVCDAEQVCSDGICGCGVNEFVSDHQCQDCPIGAYNLAGDDPLGPDTTCDAVDRCEAIFGATCDRVQQAYVKASNTYRLDRFGYSIALSGDTLAVGAPEERSCATGVGGDQADNGCSAAGAVYIFIRDPLTNTWSQQAYIKASNAEAQDRFGSSIALSGETLAVGAGEGSCATGIGGDQADNGCSAAGAVYVFTWDPVGQTWTQQAYLKASNSEAGDFFGLSIALSGETLAVGAAEGSCATDIGGDQANNSCSGAGAVYVFTRSPIGQTWTQQAYIKASNTDTFDKFSRVALSGDLSLDEE